MTTQRWNDEMLDSLAERMAELTEISLRALNIAEGNARVIQALANTAAEAQKERQDILRLVAEQQQTIEQQQTEIVGLRTETRRMMEMWLEDRWRNEGEDNSPS
jgi:hypothetical protein